MAALHGPRDRAEERFRRLDTLLRQLARQAAPDTDTVARFREATVMNRTDSESVVPTGGPTAERPLLLRIVSLLIRIVLALILLQAGISKYLGAQVQVDMFAELGGTPMRFTVATLEIAGAIGVLIPILSGVAGIGVSLLFAIIVTVHLTLYPPSMVLFALLVFVLAVGTTVLQRRQTVRLARSTIGRLRAP